MTSENDVRGYLIERKGRYYVVVSYYVEGHRIQDTKSTGISINSHRKREAERIKDKLVQEKKAELDRLAEEKESHSFADCYQKWIEYKSTHIESTTAWAYKSNSKTIIEYFRERNIRIESLQPKDLLTYYEWAMTNGRRQIYNKNTSAGLSRRTVRDHAMLIKSFLNDAVVQGIISTNPADTVKVPKEKENNTEDEVAYLNKEQAHAFLNFLKAEPMFEKLYCFSKLGLFYGLRRSELLGLKWSAIDFDKDEIVINHTIVIGMEGVICRDNVKTKSSHRYLPLLEGVKGDLLELMERQKKYGIFSKNGYVFQWEDGRIYNPDYISKLFKKAVVRCGCVPADFKVHGLRHSCCAILFEEGWDIGKVQAWLGHSDITVTANIYNHVSKRWKNKHGKLVNEVFNNWA